MDRLCFVCGDPIRPAAHTGRKPRFCSEAHRLEARKLRARVARERKGAPVHDVERAAFRATYLRDAA
jgi:hypothetical protein